MAAVADLDAVRGDLDHGGRLTVRPHSHVIGGCTWNELQVGECPCDIETNVDEGTDVASGVVESTISADCYLVMLNLEMFPNCSINMTHFCSTCTPYFTLVI